MWPCDPQNWVFWPPSTATLLPSHTCQGGCPQWSWGSDPGVGLHGLPAIPVSWPPPHREEGGRCSWQRAYLSAQYILSQLWETMHVSTKLPTRERRPRITPILASSACDFNNKTNHIPRNMPPNSPDSYVTRMLLYNKIPLERGFSFFHFGPGYNEMINFLTNFHCVY